jgi:hypothetical protein
MKIMNGKFILILLLATHIFANVIANVDKQNVIEGDSVTYSITADGNKITFPNIDKIAGFDVEAVSNSQSISIINGNYQKKLTRSWSFTPLKSITIPSYTVKVDNKEYQTKPIKISVVKDSKLNKNFKLEINASKEAIVGYPSLVDIKFYQKTNAQVSAVQMILPKGDFELKQVGKESDYFDGVYKVSEVKYFLIPKKEGIIHFSVALKLGFAKPAIDAFGFVTQVMQYKMLAKKMDIEVKKVYDGIIGNFKISINVDKTKVKENKAVNGKLIIEGSGDLSNLSDIKIDIPNATIYDNKPKITQTIKDNKIYSQYEKSFVVLADDNYTIPPVEISYYDIKEKKLKNISTKSIFVEVIKDKTRVVVNNINHNKPKIQVQTKIVTKYKTNYLLILSVFILGVIVGYLLSFIKIKKEFKLPANLYNKLLPYADNPQIKTILEKLYNKEKLTKEEKQYIKEFFENKRSAKNQRT